MRPIAAALAFTFPFAALADDLKAPAVSAKTADVPACIGQLGDRDYATREAAMKRLEEIGQTAVAPLEAATKSDVPEVAERATRLLTRIAHRLDAEKALAPTLVDLPGGNTPLHTVFEVIEKQTRYKVHVNGDQAVLAAPVKLPEGKRPFWEAIHLACDAAGLRVEAVSTTWAPNPPQPGYDFNTGGDRSGRALADAIEQLALFRKALTHHAEQIAKYTAQLKGAKDDEKKRLDGLIADERRQAARFEKLITDLEVRYGLKVGVTLPLGTVTLVARAKADTTATGLSGAVRVEAKPPTAEVLKRYGPTHLPIALSVHPEPRLHWQRVTEAVIVEAVGADGQPLTPSYFNPTANTTLANDELQFRRAKMGLSDGQPMPLGPFNMGFAALAADGRKAQTLKSVRGLIRGGVWAPAGEILAARGLDTENEKHTTRYGVELGVSVLANEISLPNSTTVVVTLRYDPAVVRPEASTPDAGGALWLENRDGRAVIAPANPARPKTPTNPYGLVAWGTDGERLALSSTSGSTTHAEYRDGRVVSVQKLRYVLLDVGGASAKKLAGVSFHGSRLQEVTVPFTLTDVPVSPGTGDGKPTDAYPYSKR